MRNACQGNAQPVAPSSGRQKRRSTLSKIPYYAGLSVSFLAFGHAEFLERPESSMASVLLDACADTIVSLMLVYLFWLVTRWHGGHWKASALSSSPERRRFLFYGLLVCIALFWWGKYVDIADRIVW